MLYHSVLLAFQYTQNSKKKVWRLVTLYLQTLSVLLVIQDRDHILTITDVPESLAPLLVRLIEKTQPYTRPIELTLSRKAVEFFVFESSKKVHWNRCTVVSHVAELLHNPLY